MKVLIAAAAFLLLLGPPLAAQAGIHPFIPALLGLACGIAAAFRGARPLPDWSGAPSRGADTDARLLSGHKVDYQPNRGIGITDIGGAP